MVTDLKLQKYWNKMFLNNNKNIRKILKVVLKVLITTTADKTFNFSILFRENKGWHFMQMVCIAHDSGAMLSYFL